MGLNKNQLLGVILIVALVLMFLPFGLTMLGQLAIFGAGLYLIFIK